MKKIMLAKYGFERWTEEDFNDDGNKFTCYKVGTRVRVSKCVSDGDAYLAARIDGNILPFEVYSQLPHYRAMDYLNGVAIEDLTDNDLIKLYNDCLEYEKEYTEAEQTIELPTIEDIQEQCKLVVAKKQKEVDEVDSMIKNNLSKLMMNVSDYEWKYIKQYYNTLLKEASRYSVDNYPKTILGTSHSIDFCKPNYSALNDSFYYRWIVEIIEKAI